MQKDEYVLTRNSEVLKEGSFSEVWAYLVQTYADVTLKQLVDEGYKIGKI